MLASVVFAFAALSAVGRPAPAVQAAQAPQSADLQQAADLHKQAGDLQAARKLDEALDAARRALEIRERVLPADDGLIAQALNTTGAILFMKGDYAAAEPLFDRALRIRRADPATSPAALAASMNNLASLLQAQGRLREAEPLLLDAVAVWERAKAPADALGTAYNNLGGFSVQRGDFARARRHFQRAADLWQTVYPPDHDRIGSVLNNLGLAAHELGDFARAEDYYRRALPIREKAGETTELARTLNNLAITLQEQGRLDDAEPLYARAIAIYEKVAGPAYAPLGQTLSNAAVLWLLRKDYGRAEPLYQRAIAIREKALGPEHSDVAKSLAAYAILLLNSGRRDEAMAHQARATDIIERNLALVLETGSESQKESYLQLFADYVDITLWLRTAGSTPSAQANDTALDTVLRRKGRLQDVLAVTTDAVRTTLPADARGDLEELARARAMLARLVLQAPGTADQRAKAVSDLEQRIDALESKLSARAAGLSPRAVPVTPAAVRGAIPAGAVLIEFFQYRPFDPHAAKVGERFGPSKYAAYALTHSGPAQWIELGDAAPIDAAIAAFRAALVDPRRTDVVERALALRPLVTERIEQLAGRARSVLIAPDGDFNLLPFQALVDARKKFLIDRYEFRYLTSARDLIAMPAPSTGSAPLVVGNPQFDRDGGGSGSPVSRTFGPLPGAEREARAVGALLSGASVLSGAAATEEAIKRARGPSILHIATHGFFLQAGGRDASVGTRALRPEHTDEPASLPPQLRSALALAGANAAAADAPEDGILTASEAAMLDLRGTEIVFLSACESGLGVVRAGEGVYGLRRALVIAGARSQVLTLWKVSDEATQAFAVDFYSRLVKGAARGQALRAAQRSALADASRRHPFYWAAFNLSGADGPIR